MYREAFRGKNVLSLASYVPLLTDCVWDLCLCAKGWRLTVVSGNHVVIITEYGIFYYLYHTILYCTITSLLFPKISNVSRRPK